LQPTANSSMERFAAVCAGTHHERIPNRSISLVDVRDTAAHHIAAYEKGYEGRFFSLTEAWPWTLVYQAVKIYCPQTRSLEALPKGTKLEAAREYNTTRMKALGVNERSFLQVLSEAIKQCDCSGQNVVNESVCCLSASSDLNLELFFEYGGYYDIGKGDGRFFLILVEYSFRPYEPVSIKVQLSWLFEVGSKPTKHEIFKSTDATIKDGVFTWIARNISLTFKRVDEGAAAGVWSIYGTIDGTEVIGTSFVSGVPYQQFMGTYSLKDASKSVALAFSYNKNTITDPDGNLIEFFSYNPLERKFYNLLSTKNFYLNVAAGQGLRITSIIDGKTDFFFKNPVFESGPAGNPVGADQLASFAGYYPLNSPGLFVSVLGVVTNQNVVTSVGICLDGKTSTEYTSFRFVDNRLNFEPCPIGAKYLDFKRTFSNSSYAEVTVGQGGLEFPVLSQNNISYFTPAPLTAFGFLPLTASILGKTHSLQIIQEDNGDLRIVYKQDDEVISSTKDYSYNPIEQGAIISHDTKEQTYVLNFTYYLEYGVSCAITHPNGTYVAAVSAVGF
jgi:hypothetical protein